MSFQCEYFCSRDNRTKLQTVSIPSEFVGHLAGFLLEELDCCARCSVAFVDLDAVAGTGVGIGWVQIRLVPNSGQRRI